MFPHYVPIVSVLDEEITFQFDSQFLDVKT